MDRSLTRRLVVSTAFAAMVAAGAGGASAWATLRFGKPGSAGLVLVLTVAVVFGVMGAWSMALASSSGDRGAEVDRGHRLPSAAALGRVFPSGVVIVALVGLLGISRLTLGTQAPVGGAPVENQGREGRPLLFRDDRSTPGHRGDGAELPLVPVLDGRTVPVAAALLILIVSGAALWWWLRGKRDAGGLTLGEGIDTATARSTVLRSIDAMLSDPDPNTAIIGAYARLLEGLAESGVPRQDFEGPAEHLRRALSHLPVQPGPVQRLVRLFQVARFSTRALTEVHRDQALTALREVAEDLDQEVAVMSGPVRPPSEDTVA